jgi:hypothetical protein
VITRETIDRKVAEMRQRPGMPLLLENEPLTRIFQPIEVDMNRLHVLEMAALLPPVRNPPMTFDPIITYIQTHYTRGPLVVRNRLQIWYPISTPLEPSSKRR